MKKLFQTSIILISASLILSACKKDSTSPGGSSNNTKAVIVDKTWWGMFTYAGEASEYYSVHFNTDSSVTWNQTLGEYQGRWSLTGNHLNINFGPGGISIDADVTSDNKLANITTSNTSVVNSGQLLPNPTQLSLDGTQWKGVYTDKIGSTYNFEMDFKSGSKVDIAFDGTGATTYSYTRSASGVTIRTFDGDTRYWFGIVMTDTKMSGTERPENKWELTKQ